MKANVSLEIAAFTVPHTVTAQAFLGVAPMWVGGVPQPPSAPPGPFTVPLSELDPATLEQLCDDFRTRVFELADKQPATDERTVPMGELSIIEEHLFKQAAAYPTIVGQALDRVRNYLAGC